jgi:hypothetical protein
MSAPGDNWIVPGANPNNQPGGVDSVLPGTNISITGTPQNPVVNSTAATGVLTVEGQSGNINLNGVGMTITGGSPVAGDITFTPAVQNVTGTGQAIVTQPTAGTFNVDVSSIADQNIMIPIQVTGGINGNGSTFGQVLGSQFPSATLPSFFTLGVGLAWTAALSAKNTVLIQLNLPISSTGFINSNSVTFGLVWGSGSSLPPAPNSPNANTGATNNGTNIYTGMLGNLLLATSSLVQPPGTDTLYLYARNNLTVNQVITITQLPSYLQCNFFNV